MKHAPFGLACCRIFVQQICILILKPNLNVTSYLFFFFLFATDLSRRQRHPQQPWLCLAQGLPVPCPGFACARGLCQSTATATELPPAISYTLGVLSARKQGTCPLSVWSAMIITKDTNQIHLSCREGVIVLL